MFRISLVYIFLIIGFFYSLFSVNFLALSSVIAILLVLYKKYNFKVIKYLRFPLLILTILSIYFDYSTWRGTAPASTLLASLCLLKLFEIEENRDVFSFVFIVQIFLLSLGIQVEDFSFLFVLAPLYIFSFYLLYLVTHSDTSSLGFKRLAVSFSKILPLVALLFFAFPRFQFGGFFFSKNFAKSGFSNQLSPGDISKLILDETEVFTAEVNFPIATSDLYWRGQVLSLNEGFSWKVTKDKDSTHFISIPANETQNYNVHYKDIWNGPLFILPNTYRVKSDSKFITRKQRGQKFVGTSLMDQKIRFEGIIGKLSEVKKYKGFDETYTQLNIEKSDELKKFVDSRSELFKRPKLVVKYLEETFFKDFKYSLSPGTYEQLTGFDDFFFNRKIGFCGHFSSASAIVFRSFGIPARIVTGYQGGEHNVVGNFYTITQKEAHAWVEYFDNGIWNRFDPVNFVAPHRIELGASNYYSFLQSNETSIVNFQRNRSNMFSSIRQYVQNIYYQVGTTFFNYDLDSQKKIFKGLRKYNFKQLFFGLIVSIIGISAILLIYSTDFVKLTLFLVLRRKNAHIKWKEFNKMSLKNLRDAVGDEVLSKYEKITYTKDNSARYRLSFIFHASKILIYERTS